MDSGDLFRARIGCMINLSFPLVIQITRIPCADIEAAILPPPSAAEGSRYRPRRHRRAARRRQGSAPSASPDCRSG